MLALVSSTSKISPMCHIGTDSDLITGWGGKEFQLKYCLV